MWWWWWVVVVSMDNFKNPSASNYGATRLRAYQIKYAGTQAGIECLKCRKNNHMSDDIRLFAAKCGHEVCNSCLRELFDRGGQYKCVYPYNDAGVDPLSNQRVQGCGMTLRKSDFKPKEYSSTHNGQAVHREVLIRDEVTKVMCHTLEDFQNDQVKYNERLEEIEDMVYKLVNGIDVQKTEDDLERRKKLFKVRMETHKRNARETRKIIGTKLREEKKHMEQKQEQNQVRRGQQRRELKLKKIRMHALILNPKTTKEERKRLFQQLKELAAPAEVVKVPEPVIETKSASPPIKWQEQISEARTFAFEYHQAKFLVNTGGPAVPQTPLMTMSVSVPYLDGAASTAEDMKVRAAAGFYPKHVAKRAIADAYSCLFGFDLNVASGSLSHIASSSSSAMEVDA
eukprot:m.156007 g.156007  ORF g.156007 m.156007 type:complete len:399 (+) comp30967_c0_seq1:38-1234(+)